MDEHHRHFADGARSFQRRGRDCIFESDEDLSGVYRDWIINTVTLCAYEQKFGLKDVSSCSSEFYIRNRGEYSLCRNGIRCAAEE